jgi:hypothetical protein
MKTARALLVVVAVVLASSWMGAQSLSYSSGQNVSPAFEGWEENADGTFSMLFGYMNRNWEEEVDVPAGPDNSFSPGVADQGQPTHFLPRRNRFVFKVRVPKDFGTKEIIWTLVTKGKTEKAYATLRLDSKVDDVVRASETGALGAGTSSPEVRSNKPPVVKIEGDAKRTARVGQPISVVALVTDDGIPKRRAFGGVIGSTSGQPQAQGRGGDAAGGRGRGGAVAAGGDAAAPARSPLFNPPSRVTVGKVVGLHLSWYVYRGAGNVTIDPPQVKPWEDTRTGANSPWAPLWQPPPVPDDGKYPAQVTFSEPGTYVLRALADDGALFGDGELTITVTP